VSEAPERPVAAEGVEIEPAADGYVIYDSERDRVHYLNHTAALVLELCTGRNSAEDISRLLQTAYELPDPPATETRECLDQLTAEGLIRWQDGSAAGG
jgi:Coenzyme PQQ synthesis protein D (PqqD)